MKKLVKQKKEKKTLENHIISQIKKSGYPLEIEISNLLDNDYAVMNTSFYFDEDLKQGRDIDIFANQIFFNINEQLMQLNAKILPFKVRTDLVIECKKSETHAWVFFMRKNVKTNGYHISGQFITTLEESKTVLPDSLEWKLRECMDFHYSDFDKIAVAYDEIKIQSLCGTKKDEHSRRELFEGINQIVKFTRYELYQIVKRISRLPTTIPKYAVVTFFFPIIVFDGKMFEVTFETKEPKIKRTEHMVLQTQYQCPYSKKMKTFMIDIVNPSYFDSLLRTIREESIKLRKNMFDCHSDLTAKIEE